MGVRPALALALALLAGPAGSDTGETVAERFRAANDLALGGDYPKAVAIYEELAAAGGESASLYWNWAQAAQARGATGEALWALLRARELDPGDRAVAREIERLREAANLDRAELTPEPLAAAGRFSRRWRLDLAAAALLALSLLAHLLARLSGGGRASVAAAWAALALGLAVAAVPVSALFARPTGVVARRGAPLIDAASTTAEAIGALREGEVVPILERSGDYVRVEDSSGARGWAHAADVRPLGSPPASAGR